MESKPKAFQMMRFSQAKKTWMIMIHNSMVCLRVHYCVQLLSDGDFFWNIPFTFSFAKVFLFSQLISFYLRILRNAQRLSQNIWCLIKTQLKNITQTIFQGGSPWATLIQNSVVCLRVHYCVQLLPEVMVVFQPFPFPFPLLEVCFLLLSFIFLGIKTKGFPKD